MLESAGDQGCSTTITLVGATLGPLEAYSPPHRPPCLLRRPPPGCNWKSLQMCILDFWSHSGRVRRQGDTCEVGCGSPHAPEHLLDMTRIDFQLHPVGPLRYRFGIYGCQGPYSLLRGIQAYKAVYG